MDRSSVAPTQSCEDTEKSGGSMPRNGRGGGAEGADIVSGSDVVEALEPQPITNIFSKFP
jgi:hypothetical protein